MRRSTASALLALLAGLVPATLPAQINLFATLTNGNETTPANPTLSTGGPRPASFGTATFQINAAMTSMSWTATIFNIDFTGTQTMDVNDNLTAAHIHAPAPQGSNAGVVWGFFGNPFNDNNPSDIVVTPFASGVGGTMSGKWDAPEGNMTTLTAQLPNILAGLSYMNFHTSQFPGGEIRGQITVVPEPSTMLLMAAGLAGLAFASRRRGRGA